MTKDEALRLALEALETCMYPQQKQLKAIAAIKEALAEPSCNPHPDAPHGFDRNSSHTEDRYVCECESWTPLQQQEPVDRCTSYYDMTAKQCQCPECRIKSHASDCAIHNEPAYPKGKCDCGGYRPEPVAYADQYDIDCAGHDFWVNREPTTKSIPLYIFPPQRPWVELTDEEIKAVIQSIDPDEQYLPKALRQFARAIEAKLRSKNHG